MKTNFYLAAITASALTFFACSSDESDSSFKYTCQLATSCIQVESVSDCSAAGGTVTDACPFNSGGGSSSSSSVGSNGGGYSGSYGSFSYGGQSYKTVVIGEQTWMAENLNYYNVSGSKCYDNSSSNCNTYGRLYNWSMAMNLPSSCNGNGSTCSGLVQSKHQGICPSGWHIPSDSDWATLENYVGGSSTAGRYLKATSGWYNNGTDSYGFAALPGGYGTSSDNSYNVGLNGYWWSASEDNAGNAYLRIMYSSTEYVLTSSIDDKSYLFSVRCVKD